MASPPTTVLVVDDMADTREMYAVYLRFKGYAVDTAENGVIALEKAIASLPDVLVLDLMMPGLHGLDALRSLRVYPDTSKIFVIVVTGQAAPGTAKEVMAAGADLFVSKPCLPEELEAAIRNRPPHRALRR